MDAFWLASILRYDGINKGNEAQNGVDVLDASRRGDAPAPPTARSDFGAMVRLKDIAKILETKGNYPRERFDARTPRYIEVGDAVYATTSGTLGEDFRLPTEWHLRIEGLSAYVDWVYAIENAISTIPRFKVLEKGVVDKRDHLGVETHLNSEVANEIQRVCLRAGLEEEQARTFSHRIATVRYYPNEDHAAEVLEASALMDWPTKCNARFTELVAQRRAATRARRLGLYERLCQRGWITRESLMDMKKKLSFTVPMLEGLRESPLTSFTEKALRFSFSEISVTVRPIESVFSQVASRRLTVRSPAGGLAFVSRLPGIESRLQEIASIMAFVEDIDIEYSDTLNERAVDSFSFLIFEIARCLALGGSVTFQLVDAVKSLVETYGSSLTLSFDGEELSIRSGRDQKRLRIGTPVPRVQGIAVGVTLSAPLLDGVRSFFQSARMDAEAGCLDLAVSRVFNFFASSRMRVEEGGRIEGRKIFVRADAALVVGIVTHEIRVIVKTEGLPYVNALFSYYSVMDRFFAEFMWTQRAGASWRTAFENFGAMTLPRRMFHLHPDVEKVFALYSEWLEEPGITPGLFYKELKLHTRAPPDLFSLTFNSLPLPRVERFRYYVVPGRSPASLFDPASRVRYLSNIVSAPLDLPVFTYQGEDDLTLERKLLDYMREGGFEIIILGNRPIRRINFSGEPCKGQGATQTEVILGVNAFPWISSAPRQLHEPTVPLDAFLSRSIKVVCYIPETNRGVHAIASDFSRFLILEDRLETVT